MKNKKIEQVRALVSNNPAGKFINDLSTGKYYHNGNEITASQWDKVTDKKIIIDLGKGSLN